MLTYSGAELDELKQTDPYKYYYYKNEAYFRDTLGINLDNPNWESIISPAGGRLKANGMDKYRFFFEAVHGFGLRFLNRDGDAILLEEIPDENEAGREYIEIGPEQHFRTSTIATRPKTKEEIPTLEAHLVEHYGFDPAMRKPSLGFVHWFMWYLTAGHWNKEAHENYKTQLTAYNENEKKRVNGTKNYQATVTDVNKANDEEMDSFLAGLTLLGSTPEKRKAYLASEARRLKTEEENAAELQKCKERSERTPKEMADAVERMDYLMGPVVDPAQTKKVEDALIAQKFISAENLKTIADIKLPEHTGFNAHELALLGYAAMASDGVLRKAILQSDPTKPVPEGEMTYHQKSSAEEQWYMHSESYFTHSQRSESNYAAHWLVYAKQDLAQALTEYLEKENPEKLGIFLRDAIARTTRHVMFQTDVTDSTAAPDYCNLIHEMIQLCGNHPDVREATEKAGLTQEMISEAIVAETMGDVWKRGLEAQTALSAKGGQCTRQMVTDLVTLRLMQTTLAGFANEIKAGPEYQAAYDRLGAASMEATLNYKKTRTEEDLQKQKDAAADIYSLDISGVLNLNGVNLKSSDNIRNLFANEATVKKLRDEILQSKTVDNLMNRTNDEILTMLLPANAKKHLDAVTGEINQKNTQNNAPQQQEVAEKNISRQNSVVSM